MAAEPKKQRPAAKRGRVRAEHHVTELPVGKALEISHLGAAPSLTVLGIDQVEGAGMGEFVNRWRYVLTWTG